MRKITKERGQERGYVKKELVKGKGKRSVEQNDEKEITTEEGDGKLEAGQNEENHEGKRTREKRTPRCKKGYYFNSGPAVWHCYQKGCGKKQYFWAFDYKGLEYYTCP